MPYDNKCKMFLDTYKDFEVMTKAHTQGMRFLTVYINLITLFEGRGKFIFYGKKLTCGWKLNHIRLRNLHT